MTTDSTSRTAAVCADDTGTLEIRGGLLEAYPDVLTPDAIEALNALAPLDDDRRTLMAARIERRAARARDRRPIAFLDPDAPIPRTDITVGAARAGAFTGSEIPPDLRRQWIQGTGPGAKPGVPIERSIRNVAYALLSGADGWMFDGEDALGPGGRRCRWTTSGTSSSPSTGTPSSSRRPKQVCRRDERVGRGFPRQGDHQTTGSEQLELHDAHLPGPGSAPRRSSGPRRRTARGFSASIVDTNAVCREQPGRAYSRGRPSASCSTCPRSRRRRRRRSGTTSSPRWRPPRPRDRHDQGVRAGGAAGGHASSSWRSGPRLGTHFVGFNTGRWDYIN